MTLHDVADDVAYDVADDVAIIGGGPAGLMAALHAAERGRSVLLFDKNREPGIKILLSGGTRCNLTHATNARGVVDAFGVNGRFLHSALAAFGPQAVVDFFEAEGVKTYIEPGGKIFPASNRAVDIRDALLRRVKQAGCTLAMNETITEITAEENNAGFRVVTSRRIVSAKKIILATGGQSYPAVGTTGDGYRFAAALGHTIVPPRTALVPITSHADWVVALQGITLPDVLVEVFDPACEKPLARRRGALLFTHFGVSGPVVLDVSRTVSGHSQPSSLLLHVDLLPDVKSADLERSLAEPQAGGGRRKVGTLLDALLPHRVGETAVVQSGVSPDLPAGEFSKLQRRRLTQTVKQLVIPVSGTMGFRKAEVTAGGVALDEVDSRTMQSKLVPGLFFAGELLDLDGPIGGFNFQAAFSTGWLAGENV
jgi:predicted Rossmann fold flavoprotein